MLLWLVSVIIRRMEIAFPASMLAVGLIVGSLSIWFITRTKVRYEFDCGRAAGEAERATLTERLAGKEDQLRELRDALDRETDQSEFANRRMRARWRIFYSGNASRRRTKDGFRKARDVEQRGRETR